MDANVDVGKKMEYIRKFLGRSKNGKARQLELIATFGIVLLCYFRQLFVILFALETNMLPVARDVCTCYRYLNGDAQFLHKLSVLVSFWIQHGLVMDLTPEIKRQGHDFCEHNDADRMHNSQVLEMVHRYPLIVSACLVVLVVLLLLPQIGYVAYDCIRKFISAADVKTASTDPTKPGASGAKGLKATRLQDGIESLKKRSERNTEKTSELERRCNLQQTQIDDLKKQLKVLMEKKPSTDIDIDGLT